MAPRQLIFGMNLPGIEINMIKENGFTFIEVILYVAIVAIVVSTLVPFAWNVIQSGVKSTTEQEVYSAGRFVSERLKLEIRNALDINTPDSNFDVNLGSNPLLKLSLRATAPDDPTLISVSSGKIVIKQGVNPAVELNSTDTQVTNLTFTNYSSADNKTKNIDFILTLVANYPGGGQEYQETVTLRSGAEIRNN